MKACRCFLTYSMLAFTLLLMTSCGTSTTETLDIETGKKTPDKKTESADDSATAPKANGDSFKGDKVDQAAAEKTAESTDEKTAEASGDQWGTIKGRIVVTGKVPAPVAFPAPGGAAAFCGAAAPMIPRRIVLGKDQGLKNAFLFLYQSRTETQKPKIHPSYEETAKDKIVVDNVNCMFEPHVMFLRTSQTLVAKNSDPTGHNIQNASRANPFNPLIAPGAQEEIAMEGPDKLPTQLNCAIHPWMKGFMIVRDEPYVAISDKDGNFEIKNMPEGEWKFQFWHESCGYMSELRKDGKPVMEGRPSMVTFTVKNGETIDLGDLTIAAEMLSDD